MPDDFSTKLPSDSFLEWAFLKWVLSPACNMAAASHIRPQALVNNPSGGTYRIDYGIVGSVRNLAIELDGFEFHGTRPAFTHDRARQNDLVNLGWQPLRFTYDMVRSDTARCVAQLQEALRSDAALAEFVIDDPIIVEPDMDPDPMFALKPSPVQPPINWFRTARARLNTGTLRMCQRRALSELGNYYPRGGRRAATVMSVGAGKTALGVAAAVAFSDKRTLIVTPGSVIRGAFDDALDHTQPGNVLYTLPNGPLLPGVKPPNYLTLDRDQGAVRDVPRSDLLARDIIVTNFHALGTDSDLDGLLTKLEPEDIDFIVVDEAHIAASDSYLRLFAHFSNARCLLMSACFQRADGKPLDADVVYRYRLIDSISEGHAKNLRTTRFEADHSQTVYEIVWPDGLREEFHGKDALQDVLKNERKLARVTARSTEPIRQLMRHTRAALTAQEQLLDPVKPRVLFSAMGLAHAEQIAEVANSERIPTAVLHYSMTEGEKKRILQRFETSTGDLQGIVQLKMLGQGYDFPPITVVVPVRPYGSFGEFYQFIGRGVRTIRHPALAGRIESHDQILDVIYHSDLGLDDHIETVRRENDMDPTTGRSVPPSWAQEENGPAGLPGSTGALTATHPEAFVLFQPGATRVDVLHDEDAIQEARAELIRDDREMLAITQAYADYASGRDNPVSFDQFIDFTRSQRNA